MTDRIRFITHQSKQVLLVDLSNCSAAEVEKTCRAVPDAVTARPRSSVLALTDFTRASVDHEVIQVMKESAVFSRPARKLWHGWRRTEPTYIRIFARKFPSNC
jgi:hypothetical protein